MKCGHRAIEIHPDYQIHEVGRSTAVDDETDWVLRTTWCPACAGLIVDLTSVFLGRLEDVRRIHPHGSTRRPPPAEVDDAALAEDYREACEVLPISPKASAALSRRCLQHILRERGGFQKRDLVDQIQEAIDSGKLTSYLASNLDYVRHVGNFAAHPIKSKSTGEVLPVEPGEAEWNLDVIERLFDFYFVEPARQAAMRADLNKKLAEAGKQLLSRAKSSSYCYARAPGDTRSSGFAPLVNQAGSRRLQTLPTTPVDPLDPPPSVHTCPPALRVRHPGRPRPLKSSPPQVRGALERPARAADAARRGECLLVPDRRRIRSCP